MVRTNLLVIIAIHAVLAGAATMVPALAPWLDPVGIALSGGLWLVLILVYRWRTASARATTDAVAAPEKPAPVAAPVAEKPDWKQRLAKVADEVANTSELEKWSGWR